MPLLEICKNIVNSIHDDILAESKMQRTNTIINVMAIYTLQFGISHFHFSNPTKSKTINKIKFSFKQPKVKG